MAKTVFARYKFQVRKGVLIVSGQRRTMRGTNYDAKRVSVPLVGRTAAELKKAMAQGVGELNGEA